MCVIGVRNPKMQQNATISEQGATFAHYNYYVTSFTSGGLIFFLVIFLVLFCIILYCEPHTSHGLIVVERNRNGLVDSEISLQSVPLIRQKKNTPG